MPSSPLLPLLLAAMATATLRNDWMDNTFSGDAITSPDTHISLHTADPGSSGGNEVSGGSYARQQVTASGWNAASDGLVDNANQIDFADMPDVTVTHFGIFDAATGGNFLWGDELDSNVDTSAGDTVRFESGDLNVQTTGS